MSGGLPRFDFYPRDWFLGTRELSREERGVYIDLLAAMYARGGPLPYDVEELRSLLGEKSVRVVSRIVQQLIDRGKIQLIDDNLINDRVVREIDAFRCRIAKAEAGRKAARAQPESTQWNDQRPESSDQDSSNIGQSLDDTSPKDHANSTRNQRDEENHPPPPSPSSKETPSREGAEKGGKAHVKQIRQGTRLDPDWKPSPQDYAYARSLGYDEKIIDELVEDFRFYWIDGPGRNKTISGWNKRFQVWCRSDKRRPGSASGPAGSHRSPAPHQKMLAGFARAALREK